MTGRPAFLVLALAAITGCESEGPAGAAISSAPRLVFPDTLWLGGAEAIGPAAFGSIRSAALLEDSAGIAVADGQSQQVHVFSLTGRHVRTLGGRGGGPGEHQAIRAVWGASGGGFCTWDVQNLRVTRFGSSGEVLATGTADLRGLQSIRPRFEGFEDDCDFVLRDERPTMDMRELPEGVRRDSVRFVLFAGDGSAKRTLLSRLDVERWFRNRDRTWGRVDLVFGRELYGVPRGSELLVGTSDMWTWVRLDTLGDTVGELALPFNPRVATERDIAEERERRVTEVVPRSVPFTADGVDLSERMAEAEREGIREVQARRTMPEYDVVARGPHGELWVRRFPHPRENTAAWFLTNGESNGMGALILPRADTILAGSENLVIVKTRDSLDVPVLYVLRR